MKRSTKAIVQSFNKLYQERQLRCVSSLYSEEQNDVEHQHVEFHVEFLQTSTDIDQVPEKLVYHGEP
jgi:hypothetical protein